MRFMVCLLYYCFTRRLSLDGRGFGEGAPTFFQYYPQHGFRVADNLTIPESQYFETLSCQPLVPFTVIDSMLCFGVLAAVKFYD
jgi:hypothetical protein